MIMIQMSGGMGNQMFYYALYRSFLSKGIDACIDDYTHYAAIGRSDNRLTDIFKLTYQRGSVRQYNELTDSSLLPFNRVRRRIFGRNEKIYKEKQAIIYEPSIFELTDCYLIGYWQTQKYFSHITNEIRIAYHFSWEGVPSKVFTIKKQIESTNSVSIHVRRGDYLDPRFVGQFGGICTDEYYRRAMEYMNNKMPDCIFYLFTNDAEWGKTQEQSNVVPVNCCDADSAYYDMALMSSCKHNIIANSSFSWWGAWLNDNPGRIVISPSSWLNGVTGYDIYDGLNSIKVDALGNIVTNEGK